MSGESSSESKILKLNSRKKIYHLVKKFAGCHFRDLERKGKFPASSLKYHLDYLVKRGLILEEKNGRNIHYFPREFYHGDKILLSMLRQESIRNILIFLLTNENCNHEEIVRFVSLSPSTVSWHINRLKLKGIVTSVKIGRTTRYKLSIDKNKIMYLLVTYQESFLNSLVNRIIEVWGD